MQVWSLVFHSQGGALGLSFMSPISHSETMEKVTSRERERAVVETRDQYEAGEIEYVDLSYSYLSSAHLGTRHGANYQDAMQNESQSVSGGKLEKFAQPIVSRRELAHVGNLRSSKEGGWAGAERRQGRTGRKVGRSLRK